MVKLNHRSLTTNLQFVMYLASHVLSDFCQMVVEDQETLPFVSAFAPYTWDAYGV